MSAHREQAHLEAPLEEVWNLVGSPSRYPTWWPRVIEVQGERFEEGDEFVQVTRAATGTAKSNFLIERARDLREIRMSCRSTGTYAHWLLTPAQGGTFVELEMGMLPRDLGHRLFDIAMGKRYFRKWSQESLDGLRDAARREREGAPVQRRGGLLGGRPRMQSRELAQRRAAHASAKADVCASTSASVVAGDISAIM